MRRLEYLGGGSEKFWEGVRTGTGVVVSWGRIGTAGQTKTRDFADVAAAEAFLAKQVAEKLKKGYVDAGAPEPATPEPAAVDATVPETPWPDEDAFDPAPGVLRLAFPRRDQGRPKRRGDLAAMRTVAELIGRYCSGVDTVLDHQDSDRELAAAFRAHLSGRPNPAGAAAVAVVLARSIAYADQKLLDQLGRALVTEHDLSFAVEATMLMSRIATAAPGSRSYGADLLRYRAHEEPLESRSALPYVVGDVRAAVAAADDQEYARLVDSLAVLRTEDRLTRVVASFLAPTETGWHAGLAPEPGKHRYYVDWLYLCTVDSPDELAVSGGGPLDLNCQPRLLPTIVRTVGPGAAATLLRWVDDADEDLARRVLTAVQEMPTDEAFRGLLERAHRRAHRLAVAAATQRFPVRALRLLAAAVADEPEGTEWLPAARELLRAHLIAFPRLVTEIVPGLPPGARAAAESAQDGVVRLPEAALESLPPVLASPPWTRTRTPPKRVVLPEFDVETRIVWTPEEREAALAIGQSRELPYSDWPGTFARADTVSLPVGWLLADGPDELARPRLARWCLKTVEIEQWAPLLLDRFGTEAVDILVRTATKDATAASVRALLPVLSVEVAVLVAREVARSVPRRSTAESWHEPALPSACGWLAHHGVAAVPYLLTAALGRAGKARAEAEAAVRELAVHVGVESVVAETERVAGAPAAAAVADVLAVDPLELLPKRLPVPGAWARPAVLPQIRLRDTGVALPAGATTDLLTMLALGRPGEPYGGVELVVRACDRASLAEFGWQLFEQWRKDGMPSKDNWALTALGALGDDETVRRLAPLIRVWPGEGGHARAELGLEVLAEIGTDVALMHLNGIARKVKFGGVKRAAADRIAQVARHLGLTTDQLADRLVPDLGLAEDGTMVLDYGPRRFVVGFDEQLRPFVSDADGARRAALPKPGVRDEDDLAAASHQRFAALKKDVRTLAADQIHRLEQAMVAGRRWTRADFDAYLAGHPLLSHVVRRLVWSVHDESGAVVGSFRLAEDRTLADVRDEAYSVPDGAVVGVAHPLHLGGEVASWAEVFADYEILQPFPQLGRPTFAFTDEERGADRLTRFEGVGVPLGRILDMTKRGWERAAVQDGGVEPGIVKPLPHGRYAVVYLDDGIALGLPKNFGDEQVLEYVFLSTSDEGFYYENTNLTMSMLDPVSASELLADLVDLVSGGVT